MNNEEKILEMLGQMQTDISGIKSDQAAMKADIAGIKTEQAAMRADIAGIKTEQAAMKADIAGIKTRLDVEVMKQFKLLAEGQQTILETLAPKSRLEALEDEMTFMKSVVKSMSQRIADLEKAQ
mgnify:CR=1 FL=1